MPSTKTDYEIIKKNYGESMAKLCRELFPTILECPGKLSDLLLSKFYPNHYLYQDIINDHKINRFKDYIYQLLDEEQELVTTTKSVKELLSEAGYDFYECHNERDIQKFKKYYNENESLCTFNGGRLSICYVFFAVKKDISTIRREDFTNPEREDRYGTSVISIQFSRGTVNTLSIKNRYNHTVKNPDATFGNNLDNIISGLSAAFSKEYNLNIDQYEEKYFELPNYVRTIDGRIYKYNMEIDNYYFCPDNIVIYNGKVYKSAKDRFLLLDYFLIDMKNKTIEPYALDIEDSFTQDITNYDKLEIINNKNNKTKTIYIYLTNQEVVTITIDEFNRIIEYKNNNTIEADNNFLKNNKTLSKLEMNKLKIVGEYFLSSNKSLRKISLPEVERIDKSFLEDNEIIDSIYLPHVKYIGSYFLTKVKKITAISLEEVEIIGDSFLLYNTLIRNINLPNVKKIGKHFLHNNESLTKLRLPKLEIVGDKFLNCNNRLTYIYVPNLKKVDGYFLYNNNKLRYFFASSLETIGDYFLFNNETLTKLSIKNVKNIGNGFMFYNNRLWVKFPALKKVGKDFLYCNEYLYECTFPKLTKIDENFLPCNKNVKWNHFPLITRYRILKQRINDDNRYNYNLETI